MAAKPLGPGLFSAGEKRECGEDFVGCIDFAGCIDFPFFGRFAKLAQGNAPIIHLLGQVGFLADGRLKARARNDLRPLSQVVRQRIANPLFPGSNPGGAFFPPKANLAGPFQAGQPPVQTQPVARPSRRFCMSGLLLLPSAGPGLPSREIGHRYSQPESCRIHGPCHAGPESS